VRELGHQQLGQDCGRGSSGSSAPPRCLAPPHSGLRRAAQRGETQRPGAQFPSECAPRRTASQSLTNSSSAMAWPQPQTRASPMPRWPLTQVSMPTPGPTCAATPPEGPQAVLDSVFALPPGSHPSRTGRSSGLGPARRSRPPGAVLGDQRAVDEHRPTPASSDRDRA
jgi:hypothetical protein